MKSFEIEISHQGSTHQLKVEFDNQDPEYRIYRREEPVGTVISGKEKNSAWESEDIQDKDFVQKIGAEIEKHSQ